MAGRIINPDAQPVQVTLEVWRAGIGNWCGRLAGGYPAGFNDAAAVGFKSAKDAEAAARLKCQEQGAVISKVLKLKAHPYDLTKPLTDTDPFGFSVGMKLAASGIRTIQDLAAKTERDLQDALFSGRNIEQFKLHLQAAGLRLKPEPAAPK